MSNPDFLETNINPSSIDPNFNHVPLNNPPLIIEDYHRHYRNSEVSSYISYVNHFLNDDSPPNNTSHSFASSLSQSAIIMQEKSSRTTTTGSSSSSFDGIPTNSSHMQMIECKSKEMKRTSKVIEEHAIAFRTKTELAILDDGYKWRKYGKKRVKSNSNPRHYYKCVKEGCKVKKKIERDPEDLEYLITTYEGIHNHESPFACLLPGDVIISSF